MNRKLVRVAIVTLVVLFGVGEVRALDHVMVNIASRISLDTMLHDDFKDFKTSDEDLLKYFIPEAEGGDTVAMIVIGNVYYFGRQIPKDYKGAGTWFAKAADLGDEAGFIMLAGMYRYGEYTAYDINKIVDVLERIIVRNGDYKIEALICFAGLVFSGHIELDSYGEFNSWLESESGNAAVQYYLGMAYLEGKGVVQNNKEAVSWFLKSAENGYPDAKLMLAKSFSEGIVVEQDYSKYVYWLEDYNNEFDDLYVKLYLGRCYYSGLGVDADYKKAFQLINAAKSLGSKKALADLGGLYMRGLGVDKDYTKARKYFQEAINNKVALGSGYLGVMYENGYGVEVNYDLARKYYKIAIDGGEPIFQDSFDNLK